LVNPFRYITKKYFFVTPLFYSYGNAAEEILWAYARARVMKRKLVVIAPARFTQILGYQICNPELFNLDFGYKFNNIELFLKYIFSFIVNLIFFVKRFLAITLKKYFKITLHERYFFPQLGRYSFWPALHIKGNGFKHYRDDLILKELITMPPPKINLINKIQEKIKFEKLMSQVDSKYVCLHVRDSGFYGDDDRRPYRNANINNYIPAIKMLIDEGFTVIRIGGKLKQMCSMKDNKFIEIDTYESKSRGDLLDLLLLKNCEFFIGMQSGPYDAALLFQKPALLLNMYDWLFGIQMKSCDRGLLKKISIDGIGEVNMLSERLALPFTYTDSEGFSQKNITFIENSPIEILEATKEFYKDYLSDFTRNPNKDLVNNKNLFISRAEEILELLLSSSEFNKPSENEINRFIFRTLSSMGFFYCNSSVKKS